MGTDLKPIMRDFDVNYSGYADVDEDYDYSATSEFILVNTDHSSGYGDDTKMIVVLKHPDSDTHWGLEVWHDSWKEESLECRYEEDEIKEVELQPVTEMKWVFVE